MIFAINKQQEDRVLAWLEEQERIALQKQREKSETYYKAAGGALTYSFTPTSLGILVEVTHKYTGNTINLSEFEKW